MIKVIAYTGFALTAFALNSILCRLALRGNEIDAAGFTLVRLASGAAMLVILSYFFSSKKEIRNSGDWRSAFFLFAYAICFSFAYLGLTAGTGALVLFGAVQITMIGISAFRGERPTGLELVGVLIAIGGLVYLVLPGLAAPPILNAALMAAAGIAWGFYTLGGKGSGDPLADTTGNFVRSLPMMAIAAVPFFRSFHLSNRGIVLAIISGAVTSGIGYAIWYAALKHHTATRAAVLQLAVPVIAAAIGVWFLSESADSRLLIAGALILGGIATTIAGRSR